MAIKILYTTGGIKNNMSGFIGKSMQIIKGYCQRIYGKITFAQILFNGSATLPEDSTIYTDSMAYQPVHLFHSIKGNNGTTKLVTLDVSLPDMNGIEVLRKMKQIDPGARVLMVTGNDQKTLEKQAGSLP